MRAIIVAAILTFSFPIALFASDTSLDFAISGLNVPVTNPENGESSITAVFLEADFTFHARSIAINGFIKSTDGYIWASFGTCKYGDVDDLLYCSFNAENVNLYFNIKGPIYSGEITAVDNNGNVFDKGTITLVGS